MTREGSDDTAANQPATGTVTRRSVLAVITGIPASLGGCLATRWGPGSSDPPTETRSKLKTDSNTPGRVNPGTAETPFDFDRVVDAVTDLKCDPTGETPCDSIIGPGLTDGTLLRFPAGTYRFDQGHRITNVDRVGIVGVGDVTFVPPAGFNGKLFSLLGGKALFQNIDIDITGEATTAGLRLITQSGFVVEDVEFVGRGTHPDAEVVNALSVGVRDPSSQGTVRNIVARRGSTIDGYKSGNGRVGIWVGERHAGRLRIENCRLEEFGNNGIYASRCDGTVVVSGGLYRNNNVSSVRLGGSGSAVREARLEIDLDVYTGTTHPSNDPPNLRAVVVEQGSNDKPGPVVIDNCEIEVRTVDRSQGGIVIWPTGNSLELINSRISIHADGVPAINGLAPQASVRGGTGITVRNSTIVGTARDSSTVQLRDRPGSVIERTAIEATGSQREGIRLIGSEPITITASRVVTSGYPIVASGMSGTDPDGCLVELGGDTALHQTMPDPELANTGDESDTQGVDAELQRSSFPDQGNCIEKSLFPDGDVSVGIISARDNKLYWVYH